MRWGTTLHDRFMLPHFVWLDFTDVIQELNEAGFAFSADWFRAHQEFRFPLMGELSARAIHLTLRQALEPWNVLGEEAAAGGTTRFVDSSLERLQVLVQGLTGDRFVVTCNGRPLPLHPTGVNGEWIAGVRYRAWQPPSCLHPDIPVHSPLTFDIVDTWMERSVAGCQYHVMHPGGRNYDQFPVKSPARFGTFGYVLQTLQILGYSATLDDRQKVIAEYWADGPSSELPPGHWVLFAKFVSDRDHHSLAQDVKMHFAMTNAVFDASVAVWGYKRQFDYVRPVTAVHYLFNNRPVVAWGGEGLGTRVILGQNWRPYQASTVVTPPFAEYVSGHSAFSASAAEVLKRYTGSDYFGESVTVPAGSSRVEPGLVPAHDLTLSWPTFSSAADEAGISRRYGGIHFVDGDLEARTLGRRVGANAYAKALTYFNGTAD